MKPLTFLIGFALLITLARCGQSGAANEGALESIQLALPDTLDLAYQDTLFFFRVAGLAHLRCAGARLAVSHGRGVHLGGQCRSDLRALP